MIGDRLGKWTIFKELGRGGMGRVFLAQEELTGRKAALKILASDLAQDAGFLQRFQREIETLAQLEHPGIVRFYESGFENGLYYYAMEYVEGQSLDETLLHRGKLPWSEVLEIARQICPALRHVHDHGIIHRDIKPSNLLCTDAGRIKLTDFGIAKVFATPHLTSTGGVVGTAEYLSPEQAAGKPVSKRSDIYSLGVVLYVLLTGKTPFTGKSMVDLLHKHRFAQFDRPQRIVPEIPYEIDEMICQLLEKEPAQRPPDCLVLGKNLDALRRKLDRKSQNTFLSQDSATVAEQRGGEVSGLPSAKLRGEPEVEDERAAGGLVGQLFNRAWFLLTLMAICIGIFAWTFWPASAETLFARGQELMEKEQPLYWERAWREYFQPLEERFPDHPYKEQLAEYRRKLDQGRASGISEAQRLFLRGESQAKEGNYPGAVRTWSNLIQVFQHSDREKSWVQQAEKAIHQLERDGINPDRWKSIEQALARAKDLRDAGHREEAEKIWSAVEELYSGDPFAVRILEEVKKAREK